MRLDGRSTWQAKLGSPGRRQGCRLPKMEGSNLHRLRLQEQKASSHDDKEKQVESNELVVSGYIIS